MENKKVSVFFCTRKIDDRTTTLIENFKNTAGMEIEVSPIENPDAKPLTKVYNEVLSKESVKDKIVVFTHDDIEILSDKWACHIERMFREHPEYGIIGVAGSAEFDENGAWWNYKIKFGQVLHRSEGKSWLTQFSPSYSHDLEQVCVIDGLFMAIEPDRITKKFDEDLFGMQFYDISFCLDNFLDGKTKIGVTTKINLAHNSVGQLKPEWHESRIRMIEKYGDKFPIIVKNQQKKKWQRK